MRISDWSSDVCSSDLLGPGIVVLIDAMPEAHQAERIVLVLRPFDEFGDLVLRADLRKHVEHGLTRAAMCRLPAGRDSGGQVGDGVGARRSREQHGARKTRTSGHRVLIMLQLC